MRENKKEAKFFGGYPFTVLIKSFFPERKQMVVEQNVLVIKFRILKEYRFEAFINATKETYFKSQDG